MSLPANKNKVKVKNVDQSVKILNIAHQQMENDTTLMGKACVTDEETCVQGTTTGHSRAIVKYFRKRNVITDL